MIMDSKNKNTTKSEITKVSNGKSGKNNKNSTGLGSQLMYLVIGAFVLFTLYSYLSGGVESKIKSYSINEFVTAIDNNSVQKVVIDGDTVLLYNNKFDINDKSVNSASTTAIGKFTKESNQSLLNILSSYNVSTSTLNNLDIQVKTDGVAMKIAMLISNLLPIIFFGILVYMMLRGVKGANMNALSFGQTKAKVIMPDDANQRVTFKDVAGSVNAKEELKEIVDFLKNPKKFLDIGATIPKGVMMTGAPGTGKTLLARAVAGEAGVPFFYLSGSEFVEMFVGVGASRVRDLFNEAKKISPTIIFIDEIDSVGRARGVGLGGGNDEREQTLNQILVEMDGFEPQEKVIVIAATNRADVLDSALLRPGRFDRRVHIDLPDKKERKEILEVHSDKKKLGEDVNFDVIAQRTPGFSGADIMSLMNEAAILAARAERKEIMQDDILRSIEKVMMGPERKSHVMNNEEKKLVAYHEAGHALLASLLPNSDPVQKISIISRGSAGGYTLKLPDHDRRLNNREHIIDDIIMTLGGYAAETVVYGTVSTGPSNDLQVATRHAREMVTEYGMGDSIGIMAIENNRNASLYGSRMGESEISNNTLEKIDNEVKSILNSCKDRAIKLLSDNRELLDKIVARLIEVENLERDEYEELLKSNGIIVKSREQI